MRVVAVGVFNRLNVGWRMAVDAIPNCGIQVPSAVSIADVLAYLRCCFSRALLIAANHNIAVQWPANGFGIVEGVDDVRRGVSADAVCSHLALWFLVMFRPP